MTVKQLVKNILHLPNLKYLIKGKYKLFIIRQYNKYYPTSNDLSKDNDKVIVFNPDIEKALYKAASCPECYFNGDMKCCGCDFKEAILTNKKCKNNKF